MVRSDPYPTAVGTEGPRVGLITCGVVEYPDQSTLDFRVIDRNHHLDPAIEIAFHQIG